MKLKTFVNLIFIDMRTKSDNSFDLKCVCININPGYNEELKRACPALSGYARYVEKVREKEHIMSKEAAVLQAVDECIEEKILEDFFMENGAMIISSDALDETYEARIEAIKSQYTLIINNKNKELDEKDRIIEELMKQLNDKKN